MRRAFSVLVTGLTVSACTAAPGRSTVVQPAPTPPRTASAVTATRVSGPDGARKSPTAIAALPSVFRGDVAAHDPSFVRALDGTFYVYSTHDLIQVRSSRDGRTFIRSGSAFAEPLSWSDEFGTTTDLWAPDVSWHSGKLWMYYAVSSFGSQHSAIGLATSRSGAPGSWGDEGLVFATHTGDEYNAIDPNLLVSADGTWWLTFGSFWSGLAVLPLDSQTGKPRTGAQPTLVAQRDLPLNPIEAGFQWQHGGWFYLFASFDFCCRGKDSTYRIVVGRSRKPTGPFVDEQGIAMTAGGGTQLLASTGHMHGPGGQSVVATTTGDRLVFHYYGDDGAPVLASRPLSYVNGFPVVSRK